MDRRAFMAGSACGLASCLLAERIWPADLQVAATGVPLDAAAFHAERKHMRTSQGNIAYVERGAGPVALFLHGFPLNGFQWRGALERLAPYRRCIAPDFLGMGYTEVAADQSCAPEAQVDMLLAFMDALAMPNVDIVANDSGGAVAQLLIARDHRRVRTLLLTNCDSEQDCPPPALLPVIELAKKGRFVHDWLGKWQADKSLARSPEGIGGMCFADPTQPTDEAIDTYFKPLLSSQQRTANAHAYAMALERNVLSGVGSKLRRCKVPARIVWGTADGIFSKSGAKHLDHSFGHSRGIRWLEGSKLFWPEERPDVIAEEARQLWNAWIPGNRGRMQWA